METTAHAVEVSFDEQADEAIRTVWRGLDDAGVASLDSLGGTHRPHLSLSVFSGGRLGAMTAAIETVLGEVEVPALRLSHLGFFLAPKRVLFCGITPTEELLICQRAVDEAIRSSGGLPWPHYSPRTWVPHCTLAMDFEAPLSRLQVLADLGLPLLARARSLRLVEVPSGSPVADLDPFTRT